MDLKTFWFLLCSVPFIRCTWTPSYTARWKIKDPDNPKDACLLLTGDFVFTVPYLLEDENIGHAHVEIPKNGVENGTCTERTQEMSITWPVPSNTSLLNIVTFVFSENGSSENPVRALNGYYQLAEVSATLHTNLIQFPLAANPDRVIQLSGSFLTLWTAPLRLSYFCDTEQEVSLNVHGAFLRMAHVQVQPFRHTPEGGDATQFSIRSYCSPDVQGMMTNGLLFITMLFLVSILIAFAFQRQRRAPYRPL